MTDHLTENARLRAALDSVVASYDRSNPMRTADMHLASCRCLRCTVDEARAALATPAPDAVQEAAIAEVVQHESTRRWFHGEATHEEIMECVKAMDAAVAKWRAIAGDRT